MKRGDNVYNVKLINEIFSYSDIKYGLSLFSEKEVNEIEKRIKKTDDKFYIENIIDSKLKLARPEEIVRQLWINRLINKYNYEKERIKLEYPITFGSRENSGSADIAILNKKNGKMDEPYILIETKRPSRSEGLKQLKSYCNAQGSPIGVWSNGNEVIYLYREKPNIYNSISEIPKASQTLDDILNQPVNIEWLEHADILNSGKTTLKKIIEDLEEIVLGNSGVEPFDELFKLIYSKLYDEYMGIYDPSYTLQFYSGKKTADEVYDSIKKLFDDAIGLWPGVFNKGEQIKLRPELLKEAVSFLQNVKLFYSNLSIIDEAFEYLVPQASKTKEGQFFTPRPIEDMCVKMLNPQFNEYIIDPACGSGGFLLHSIMNIDSASLNGKSLSEKGKAFAKDHVYGLDFSEKAIKVSRAVNIIVGDGKTHICSDNSLDYCHYSDDTRSILKGFRKGSNYRDLKFDILLTNPPFAGDIHEKNLLNSYDLSKKNGDIVKKIDRHILFIERSLQMVRPGGRLAIVLPQGIFNNSNAEYIRNYIMEKARILAVIGLHINTFKPYTGTKTSIIFLKKYTDDEIKRIERSKLDYIDDFNQYLDKLHSQYSNIDYNSDIENLDDDCLSNFIDSNFDENDDISDLLTEKQDLENGLEELNKITEQNIKRDINRQKQAIKKLEKEIREKTTGGKVFLTLHDEKITEEFRKYYIDNKIVRDMNYKIFFGINEKPLKDNSGNYIFKQDSSGHLIHDSDLIEIADAFIKFAKEELENGDKVFDFWGN